jgi:4a-hydroxytetrahydrobiopterin dehydratase
LVEIPEVLEDAHCKPLEGSHALSDDLVKQQIELFPDWALEDGFISRSFGFADYYETLAFVNAMAYMVHREDHHPELVVQYNRVRVRFNTHSVNGISRNDFICAAKCDALYRQGAGKSA